MMQYTDFGFLVTYKSGRKRMVKGYDTMCHALDDAYDMAEFNKRVSKVTMMMHREDGAWIACG